jgi:hypothetical protein
MEKIPKSSESHNGNGRHAESEEGHNVPIPHKLSRQDAENVIADLNKELLELPVDLRPPFDIDLDTHSEYFIVHVGGKKINVMRHENILVELGSDADGTKKFGVVPIKNALKAIIVFPELPLLSALHKLDIPPHKVLLVREKSRSKDAGGSPFRFADIFPDWGKREKGSRGK